MLLNVRVKNAPIWGLFVERTINIGWLENPLSNLHRWNDESSQCWGKTDPSTHSASTLQCTGQQSESKQLHLCIFSSNQILLRVSQSGEDGQILHNPWMWAAPQINALLAELSPITTEKQLCFSTQKRKNFNHTCSGAFWCLLVNTLLEDSLGEASIWQLN